jgi:hypothetical protein
VDGTARAGVWANGMTGLLIALIVLADRLVLGWFLPAGSAALEPARHLNHIAIGSFVFFGVTFVLSGVVRSTGAVIPPLVILGLACGACASRGAVDAALAGRGCHLVELSHQLAVRHAAELAYYRWGHWRQAQALPDGPAAPQATPAEVGGQPPTPVCSLGGDEPEAHR